MLVLSRKKNESIVIDDKIVITVVDVRGDKVRLGIQAPREVSVHREEVYRVLKEAELQASQGDSGGTSSSNDVSQASG